MNDKLGILLLHITVPKKKHTKDIRRTLLPHNSDHKYGITKDTVHLSHVSNGTQGFQRQETVSPMIIPGYTPA